ncbi:hypothetical protein ACFWVP_21960 [Streptomyces sp. NPDC058637]|uniref:hypothetical protein n=1 Tax=Streptomyces sp. NPDC058637 TaxID=3346569 RepID=UPI0036548470
MTTGKGFGMHAVRSVRARRWLTAVGLAMTLGAGSVACASDDAEAEHEAYVGAEEVCGGLFAGPTAKMVEDVTGRKLFAWRNSKSVEDVVRALKDGYASGRSWAAGDDLCELVRKGATPTEPAGGVKFSMYAPHDVGDPGLPAGAEFYTMGQQSEVARSGAALYFECVTPQLKDSDKNPLRIHGSFGRGKSDAPDTREYRNLNMTILHAVSLKLVKALDCENNGGLPKDPVLSPK